jgi:hypothetical protein
VVAYLTDQQRVAVLGRQRHACEDGAELLAQLSFDDEAVIPDGHAGSIACATGSKGR